ncbi:MAG TPA: amino acid adenylation domain-containing protein, partial [Longimicrobiaceae bacterium]
RRVVCSGETLGAEVRDRFFERLPHAELHNLYGPTEAAVDVTYWPCLPRGGRRVVPIGRPVANTRVHVLDGRLDPVPVGVPGELFIGGVQVGRGYHGRPELTAERFVPDPFAGRPGARAYRTGDLVRWLPDGVVEYLGRIDFQVKVRGFRIEPGEVEAALLAHPGVREVVAVVRGDAAGEKRLVAYVTGGAEAGAAELRAWLRERLPEYMVPSAIVALERLPLSPNGKTDRRALPDPDWEPAEREHVPPRTPTEEVLAGIWADVLGRERVGVTDDFVEIGGHSLLATRVAARAQAALGTEVPLRDLFDTRTVAGLAARLDAALREGLAVQAPPVVPVPRDGSPLPLSFAQQRLWTLDQLEPGSTAYNVPLPLRLRGALDAGALRAALEELVRRHEALRTVLVRVQGEPAQTVLPAGPRPLPWVELGGLREPAREAEALRLAEEDATRPFDLARGPLLRAALVRLGAEDHALLLSLHHVVSDGWSLGVLTHELAALYGAFAAGRPSPLPELPVQYADFAVWQRAWLSGDVLQSQIAFWRRELHGAPPLLELPTDHPRPAVAGYRGALRGFTLPAAAAEALRALARREGATLYTVLLAGFQALLGRWAGAEDVPVGTPVAGRGRLETEPLIGFFVNTLVVRADLSGDPDGRELVARARERVLAAHAHQDLPFERLVDELRVERSLAHSPLFQVMFAFESGRAEPLRLGGVEAEPLEVGIGSEKFDLTLGMRDDGERLEGAASFRVELWEGATVERMLGHLAALLEGIARDPGRPVSAVPLLGEAERARVLEEWNDTARDYPAGVLAHDLFAEAAARAPEAVAVRWRGERTTYAELQRRAGRIAHALRRRGVGPESRVGVCLSRTPELVAALLGVLRAGGAYVPLDPAYPRERLGWMMEDAGVELVLTEAALADRLPEGGAALLVLDREEEALAAEPERAPESGVGPENLSHVIFTSGSTGRPKGVMIRHASVAVLLHWLRETMSDEERASVLFSTSVNFDVSVAEVFGTLCWGGSLVLVENALELASVGEEVATASMVPSAAAELLRSGGIPASVRTLNLGGEALPAPVAQGLLSLGTVERVRNLYGPTEDTTYSTCSLVPWGAEQVMVGRPVANTRALVLDAHLQPAPVGVVGELYLAGDGLARGYAGRPDLTAERFLPSPFGPAGSRMYRVMDRVRWRPDGELEYFGRTDFQVKVRGFRIEPGEIESALLAQPGVREAVVVARGGEAGEKQLVAYVVAGADADPAELRARLRERLPEYMVPAALVPLDRLPLTPNGKVDRRALPDPQWGGGEEAHEAPRDATEAALRDVWSAVLGVERVGVRDDFFDLGGHSLSAIRLVARVNEAFGVALPTAALLRARTVRELAEVLREHGAGAAASALVPIQPHGSRPPLFCVHAAAGTVLQYLPLAERLGPDQPLYGLEALPRAAGADVELEELAAEYVEAVLAARPEGPFRLGGWSLGGVIAFEMARQLRARGEEVDLLLLLDAFPPLDGQYRGEPDPLELLLFLAHDLGYPRGELEALGERLAARSPKERPEWLAEELRARVPDLAGTGAEEVRERAEGYRRNLAAAARYRPAPYEGRTVLVRAAEGPPEAADPRLRWSELVTTPPEVRTVAGDHYGMLAGESARALALLLEPWLGPTAPPAPIPA